jgi:NIMA (never in mitosis gene a)-related kinase
VNILRELRHPHIVRYYDRIIDKAATKLYIVMEYCEGGDLGAVIKKCKREGSAVEEDVVWKVLAQITAALKECHRHREAPGAAAAAAAGSGGGAAPAPGQQQRLKPILHRDLKPGNIFLDAAQNVKIGDFGLAKELASESKFAYTNVGTPFYMSPEMINEMRYNEKSDIWALGCLVFELCALVPPFEAQNQLALAVKINAGKFNRIPARYSEDLYRAIRWMLQVVLRWLQLVRIVCSIK